MTLAMPDSIRVADLPAGYPAYLGYADGNWPTATDLAKRFPQAHRVILTVTGGDLNADGIDCEPGNPDARSSAEWVARVGSPGFRPVIYASVIGTPGYGMGDVLNQLAAHRIPRASVRLLTAHYEWKTSHGADPINLHICGPSTCNLLPVEADGTQWTDVWPGANHGSIIDLSALRPDFFGTPPPPPTWTENLVKQLPTVAPGATGTYVRTIQFQCGERHHPTTVDGVFGPNTESAVRAVQSAAHVPVDGIVGQQTWPVLLGVA